MRRTFMSVIILFLLTACGAAARPAAPTATAALLPTSTLATTETPTATAVPAESPVSTEANLTIADLERGKFGDFTFVKDEDGSFGMQDKEGNLVKNIKVFKNETVELVFADQNYIIDFKAVKIKESKLIACLWDFENSKCQNCHTLCQRQI